MTRRNAPVPRAPFSYRGDPAVPPFPDDRPIIVFDGQCVPLMAVGRLVPLPVRDHEQVARNRYRWFGIRQTCYQPNPSEADRFLA